MIKPKQVFNQFLSKIPSISRVYQDFAVLPWYFAMRLLMVALLGAVYAQVKSNLSVGNEPIYDFGILAQAVDLSAVLSLLLAVALLVLSFIFERNIIIFYFAQRYRDERISAAKLLRGFVGTLPRQVKLFLLEYVIYFGLLVFVLMVGGLLFLMFDLSAWLFLFLLPVLLVGFLLWARTFLAFIFALFNLFSADVKKPTVFAELASGVPRGILFKCVRIWIFYLVLGLLFAGLAAAITTAVPWIIDILSWGGVELFLLVLLISTMAALSVLVASILSVFSYGDTIQVLTDKEPPAPSVNSKSVFFQKASIIGPVLVFLVVIGSMTTTGVYNAKPLVALTDAERQVLAHRGASINNVQNSLAAFEAAVGKADYIELDVQITKDGKIIVFHDPNFEDLTGEVGIPSQREYAEIATYTVSEDKVVDGEDVVLSAKIPLLEDVFEAVGDDIAFAVEIKNTAPERMEELVRETIRLMRKYDQQEKSFVISLDYNVLLEVQKIAPEIRRGIILTVSVTPPEAYDVDIYFLNALTSSFNQMRQIHSLGRKAYFWTFAGLEQDFQREFFMGADGFIADDPTYARRLTQNYLELPVTRKIINILSTFTE